MHSRHGSDHVLWIPGRGTTLLCHIQVAPARRYFAK